MEPKFKTTTSHPSNLTDAHFSIITPFYIRDSHILDFDEVLNKLNCQMNQISLVSHNTSINDSCVSTYFKIVNQIDKDFKKPLKVNTNTIKKPPLSMNLNLNKTKKFKEAFTSSFKFNKKITIDSDQLNKSQKYFNENKHKLKLLSKKDLFDTNNKEKQKERELFSKKGGKETPKFGFIENCSLNSNVFLPIKSLKIVK